MTTVKPTLFYTIIKDLPTLLTWVSGPGKQAQEKGYTILIAVDRDISCDSVPSSMKLIRTKWLDKSLIGYWTVLEEYSRVLYSDPTSGICRKKHLLYTCVGLSNEYCEMARILMKSIQKQDTENLWDLYVITQPGREKSFQEMGCKTVATAMNSIYEASATKLKVYDLIDCNPYETILFIDADCVIEGSLSPCLGFSVKGKICGFREGNLLHSNYSGTDGEVLAGLISRPNSDAPGFSAGVLLWMNCAESQALIEEMNEISRPGQGCLEQPWVNRVLWERAAGMEGPLGSLVSVKPEEDPRVINHFCGSIGIGINKLGRIRTFLERTI